MITNYNICNNVVPCVKNPRKNKCSINHVLPPDRGFGIAAGAGGKSLIRRGTLQVLTWT